MSRLYPLLARFGLFAQKSLPECDMFDLRLTRIESREARAQVRGNCFRSQSSHSADAALS
ncbi:hypothetical protein [Tabrizicola oligotrophica]|uniref:Uncharacterized protein n=1 Tax=Tabrizicola oligotrophica TaxID=2710650 RepID=A0A6M0QSY3_9RHOB|nr:hypothetical protein [Tabrizicola oligotrophica]NEY90558.1 hypothetical protein [Tabrizicola oligotrophica]